MSQMFPAGLPTVSQNTARVFPSISFSMLGGWSVSANRTMMPCPGKICANSVCVVPYSCGTETMLLPISVDIEHGVIQRGLSRAHAQSLDAALQFGDAAFQHGSGRVADAAVAIARDFEIEQSRAVIGAVKLVSDGLIDRDRNGLGRRVGLIAAMNSDRLAFHYFPPRLPTRSVSIPFCCVIRGK